MNHLDESKNTLLRTIHYVGILCSPSLNPIWQGQSRGGVNFLVRNAISDNDIAFICRLECVLHIQLIALFRLSIKGGLPSTSIWVRANAPTFTQTNISEKSSSQWVLVNEGNLKRLWVVMWLVLDLHEGREREWKVKSENWEVWSPRRGQNGERCQIKKQLF